MILAPLTAFLVAALAVALLKRLARRKRWVDRAGDDPLKIHGGDTPVLGGLGIALGALAGLATAGPLGSPPWLLGAAAFGACLLGLRDDLGGLPPLWRLGIELLLGAFVGWSFLRFGPAQGGFVLLGSFLYIGGAINALNMQDGIDGLAGTLTLLSCIGFAVVHHPENRPAALLAIVMAGAVLGFLLHNRPPASIFMGDNGAYFLGLLLGAQGLWVLFDRPGPRTLAASVLLIGLPVLDAALAILRRLARGVSPFRGDRDHLYDLLAKRGLSTWKVLAVCGLAQAALVALGVLLATS